MKNAPNSLVSKRNDAAFTTLVQALSDTHTWTQGQSARALNTHLAIRNWLFGWYSIGNSSLNALPLAEAHLQQALPVESLPSR